GFDPGRSASHKSRLFALGLGTIVRPAIEFVTLSDLAVRAARPVINKVASFQGTSSGITISSLRSNGIKGLWLDNPEDDGRVILYLHGGGFVVCGPDTHKGLVSGLCKMSGSSALLLDYRLAPEHTFPAAADDALTAYQMLLSRGYDPGNITLGGDSAGGHLVTRLLADLDERGLPMPAGAVLFSPFLDLNGKRALQQDKVRRDPFIPPKAAIWAGKKYAGTLNPGDTHLCIQSKDKRNWPPILIQVGDTECLLPDSERLARSLERAGVPVTLQVWAGQVHVFQGFPSVVPEARAAVREAGRFLRSVASSASAAQTA
ncbi:MAG TPA: alpha/beta hydrolase, partial [Nocardioidaceae bacterium]|nr:alpha/beta hydrolase [Nocardioidaceae bacterium]